MKLADWLHARSMTPEQLRRMLGVKSRTTIRRYLTGARIPNPAAIAKIEHLTHFQVTRSDFEDPNPPECAVVVRYPDGSRTMIFPWSQEHRRQALLPDPDYRPEWKRPTDALQKAMNLLGKRATITKRGHFLLEGRPSDARRFVLAANEILRKIGEAEIEYPTVRRKD